MNVDALYPLHVALLRKKYSDLLKEEQYDGLVIHAGTPVFYHSDDQEMPFRTLPFFASWLPLQGGHHLLILQPDQTPRLVRVTPEDYWYEHVRTENPFWEKEFDLLEVSTAEDAWKLTEEKFRNKHWAFVGDLSAAHAAEKYGISREHSNPSALITALEEIRTIKTPYEVVCIEEANKIAAAGHRRAHDMFLSGGSELDIHHAYLAGSRQTENWLPYPAITALDEKAAVLHYQNKRDERDGAVCLLDAGAMYRGYASDITRTWARPKADGRFVQLIEALNELQQNLSNKVTPSTTTLELHHEAHAGIAHILYEHNLISIEGEEAIQKGITAAFFPHGLGHFLGVQVHDVGKPNMEQVDEKLRAQYPKLRAARVLQSGNVITVEPGIYFIPLLLKRLRESEQAKYVLWERVDALSCLGGIRIEDDILVTEDGSRNLTRPYLE